MNQFSGRRDIDQNHSWQNDIQYIDMQLNFGSRIIN